MCYFLFFPPPHQPRQVSAASVDEWHGNKRKGSRDLTLHLEAKARVPNQWTQQQIEQWLKKEFPQWETMQVVPYGEQSGVVYIKLDDEAGIEPEQADGGRKAEKGKNSTGEGHGTVLQAGGARNQRIQTEAICEAACTKISDDLRQTKYGLMLEAKLIKHIVYGDAKCARAIFQSQTASQRAMALAAALHRTGLTAFAQGMEKAAKVFSEKHVEEAGEAASVQQDEDRTASSATCDPYMELPQQPAKKRGRPLKAEIIAETGQEEDAGVKDAGRSKQREQSEMNMGELRTRLDHIERWAHGIDTTLDVKAKSGQNVGGRDGAERSASSDVSGVVEKRLADLEKLVTQQENDMQVLRISITELYEQQRKYAGTSKSSEGQAAGMATRPTCSEGTSDSVGACVTKVQQDRELGKLWALYHRLQHRLDTMGILPEVSVIYPRDRHMVTAAAGNQVMTGVCDNEACERVRATVEQHTSQINALTNICNTLWPWVTTIAAKTQEMSPLVCQLSSQVRSVMMRLALLACPPTMPPVGPGAQMGTAGGGLTPSQGARGVVGGRAPRVVPPPVGLSRHAH
eukprot:5119540-Amphidinium_carterae.2